MGLCYVAGATDVWRASFYRRTLYAKAARSQGRSSDRAHKSASVLKQATSRQRRAGRPSADDCTSVARGSGSRIPALECS